MTNDNYATDEKIMEIVELFAGTQSFSKVARARGHKTFCVDNDKQFNNDLTLDIEEEFRTPDINQLLYEKIKEADIIWMSPPCTTFSMASGNTHWTRDRKPKTEEAKLGRRLLNICWSIAEYCIKHNQVFFIENPRARARWFLPEDCRKTAWYCQYGDKRAKPTDIWTNLDWKPKTCKNGNKDCHHEPAPRGSKTGTQGLKGSIERGVVPEELCLEVIKLCESSHNKKCENKENKK